MRRSVAAARSPPKLSCRYCRPPLDVSLLPTQTIQNIPIHTGCLQHVSDAEPSRAPGNAAQLADAVACAAQPARPDRPTWAVSAASYMAVKAITTRHVPDELMLVLSPIALLLLPLRSPPKPKTSAQGPASSRSRTLPGTPSSNSGSRARAQQARLHGGI